MALCPSWCPRLVLVHVLLLLLEREGAVSMSEYEIMTWDHLAPQGALPYGKGLRCVPIPEDLRLCYNVGYKNMLLPNLLEHESLAEVRQQASSWVPLMHKRCHVGTQMFLCSLFAPVCLEGPVKPCRALCEAVRQGCEPVMEAYGFSWPSILHCDKFPQEDPCIPFNITNMEETPGTDALTVCPVCDIEMNTGVILGHMCASEFTLKMKIKNVKEEGGDKKVILLLQKKGILTNTRNYKMKTKMEMFLKNGATCMCPQLENRKSSFLIMGRMFGEHFLLTGIHQWRRTDREFMKVVKKLKKHKCPDFEAIL
ncbi:secreted frizzled-related protein 1b [Hoplias malabaricus]|uniref:secreted frizzled-related protein 1b n=1 Tax=Hoplias malabaricus TaxID=27720 RepID=UPI003461D759